MLMNRNNFPEKESVLPQSPLIFVGNSKAGGRGTVQSHLGTNSASSSKRRNKPLTADQFGSLYDMWVFQLTTLFDSPLNVGSYSVKCQFLRKMLMT